MAFHYKLKKNLPELNAGAIFEHRPYDPKHPDRGNVNHGCLILGWINGGCQQNWGGETFIFPGQLARNKEWFEPFSEFDDKKIILEKVKQVIEKSSPEQLKSIREKISEILNI